MPSRDDDDTERSARRHRKDKDTDQDRERGSTSSRDKHSRPTKAGTPTTAGSGGNRLHKRRSSSRERERDRDRDRERDSPRSALRERREKKVSMMVPEGDRRSKSGGSSGEADGDDGTPGSRPHYPSFSKAHSREAVGSREDMGKTLLTPQATELSGGRDKDKDIKERRRNSTPANTSHAMPSRTPPSPPLTAENPDIRRSGSGSSMRAAAQSIKAEMSGGRRSSMELPIRSTPESKVKIVKKDTRFADTASEASSMPGAFPEELEGERKSTPTSGYRRTISTTSQPASNLTQDTDGTGTDSDATSIAPEYQRQMKQEQTTYSRDPSPPPTATRTKTPAEHFTIPPKPTKTPIERHIKPPRHTHTPVIDVGMANLNYPQSFGMTPITALPPPPPPPPPTSTSIPRVDYLLKNGGLPTPISKRLVQTTVPVQTYNSYQSPALLSHAPLDDYARVFSGLHKRLDDYVHVMRSHGSLAVATGYKSVARRLLDKLSQVFARDISSQRCDCVICQTTPQVSLSDEEDSGVSWGEILEFVSGRRELPQWPPFSMNPSEPGLGITNGALSAAATSPTTQSPMQKLDIDVPEEYREHYIRQNQKTKRAVQNWLSQQPDVPASPPDEADEDTLMFAMMTKLAAPQRNLFIALMHGHSEVAASRAPTPAERPTTSSTALRRARKALHRLYRLERPPRDCESAMYLLNNPPLHGMLATLAEVNEAEWDILVSGRFDGFLWSGAEMTPFPFASASVAASPSVSRGPSRNSNFTPFSVGAGGGARGTFFSRNPTPLSRDTTPFSGVSAMPPSRGPASTPYFAPPLRNPAVSDQQQQNMTPPMFPSRNPTPGPLSTGFPNGPPPPVQLDEDTEIAVLAEVERNLFNDMERFEDAFEALHSRAELVRQQLRERGAGLAMAAQMRRGGTNESDAVQVRLDTPASGITDFSDGGDDDGLGDVASLAPDDSASQISVNRRGHRHRRVERVGRGTPAAGAVVVEEGEGGEEAHGVGEREAELARVRGGRRSKY